VKGNTALGEVPLAGFGGRVSFRPDGKEIVVASEIVAVWDASLSKLERRIGGLLAPDTLACAPNGRAVMTYESGTGLARIDAPGLAAKQVGDPRAPRPSFTRMLGLRPTSDALALVLGVGGAAAWVGEGADKPGTVFEDRKLVRFEAASPNGTRVAAIMKKSGDPADLAIWDTETGKAIAKRPALFAKERGTLVWSRDAKTLVVATPGSLYVLDGDTGATRKIIPGPTTLPDAGPPPGRRALAVGALSPRADRLAVRSGQHLDIWDLASGTPTKRFETDVSPQVWTDGGLIFGGGQALDVDKAEAMPFDGTGPVCASGDGAWMAYLARDGLVIRRKDGRTLWLGRVAHGAEIQTVGVEGSTSPPVDDEIAP